MDGSTQPDDPLYEEEVYFHSAAEEDYFDDESDPLRFEMANNHLKVEIKEEVDSNCSDEDDTCKRDEHVSKNEEELLELPACDVKIETEPEDRNIPLEDVSRKEATIYVHCRSCNYYKRISNDRPTNEYNSFCDDCYENIKLNPESKKSDKDSGILYNILYDSINEKPVYNDKAVVKTQSQPKLFNCNLCEKSFNRPSKLANHIRSHTGEKPFTCDECGKSFVALGHLNMHVQTHSGIKPYSCKVCNKSFTKVCNLNRHELIHTGIRPFTCEECGKSFSQLCHLNRHSYRHSSEGVPAPSIPTIPNTEITLLDCNVCGKSFSRVCNLNRHVLIHMGEKPYGCDECGKSFTQLSHLTRHSYIHTGEKPFACEVCGKAFARATSLHSHKLTHTER